MATGATEEQPSPLSVRLGLCRDVMSTLATWDLAEYGGKWSALIEMGGHRSGKRVGDGRILTLEAPHSDRLASMFANFPSDVDSTLSAPRSGSAEQWIACP